MTRIDEMNQLFNERDAIYDRISLQSGLSDLAFRILYYIRIEKNREWLQSEIADTYFLSRKSVNSAVEKLTKEGYVLLSSNPGKGNRKTMRLTEQGTEFCKRWIDPIIEADNQSFLKLDVQEQDIYLKLERKALALFKEENFESRPAGREEIMKKEVVRISDHFTFKRIFRITIAPILMMVFSSLYSVVDGFFVSNYAGKNAFTAVNLIFPVIMIVAGIGFMFGTGGSAFVSALLGKKEEEKAKKAFSMTVYFAFLFGLALSIIIFFCIEPIVRALASINEDTSEETIKASILYGRIMMGGECLYILQNTFQSFFSVAEKPGLGFLFTLFAGLTNMLFDFLFIGVLKYGIIGAATASLMGMAVGSIGPFIYFSINKKNQIHLGFPEINIKDLLQIMSNGSSEFVSNISASVVSMVFNIQLLRLIGENGVSAYGIIMYVSFIFMAIFLGYSIGMAPAVGYNYGAENKDELKNILHKSIFIIGITGIFMIGLSEAMAIPFSKIFSSGSEELEKVASTAMRIYSISYLFCGFSIYGSSFFTALNNGLISALISIIRTLGFQLICVIIFPMLMGVNGIWWSMVIAETGSFLMTVLFLSGKRKRYGY